MDGQGRVTKRERVLCGLPRVRQSGENINKYLTKGRPLFVEGRLDFDQWTAQDGTKRSKHRVTVESFQFIGSPGGAASQGPARAG